MKVLHVMAHSPCPPDNGASADIWARLQALRGLGHEVDAVVIQPKSGQVSPYVEQLQSLVRCLQFVERRPLRRCLATMAPTCVSRNKGLADVPLRDRYDVTLMEAEDALPICDNPSLKTAIRVLRVHNNEVRYFHELARSEERFAKRQFLRLEALRMLPFSNRARRRVDSLWFISQSECQSFAKSDPDVAAKAVWVPPAITLKGRRPRSGPSSKRVLAVGNFYTPLNREGLRWYVQHVHPRLLRHPDYELVLAGSTQRRREAELFAEQMQKHERCRVHVNLDDASPLYDQCAVFINPMQAGAGVKLKTVHAIENGIPVVSTSVGNDGSGFIHGRHLRLADSPSGFEAAVRDLLDDREEGQRMADRAYEYLVEHYDCVKNIRWLLSSLHSQVSLCSKEMHPALLA
jgi:glycosyltransferase involved in cell wall biosynthesis